MPFHPWKHRSDYVSTLTKIFHQLFILAESQNSAILHGLLLWPPSMTILPLAPLDSSHKPPFLPSTCFPLSSPCLERCVPTYPHRAGSCLRVGSNGTSPTSFLSRSPTHSCHYIFLFCSSPSSITEIILFICLLDNCLSSSIIHELCENLQFPLCIIIS